MKRGMNRTFAMAAIIGAAALLLGGCGEKPPEPQAAAAAAAPAPAPAPPPKPPYTKVQWQEAFRSAFEERDKKINSEGITEYMACRDKTPAGTCGHFAFGTRDAFRKIDHLTPASTQLNETILAQNYLGIYVAALECEAPSLFVSPAVNRRGGWLFMQKVALMADGEVVMERDFSKAKVERDATGNFIHERASFIAKPAEREAIKTFMGASSRIIRITGEKGYVTVDKSLTNQFVEDAGNALAFIGAIEEAFKANGGPVCDAVPETSAAPASAPAATPKS